MRRGLIGRRSTQPAQQLWQPTRCFMRDLPFRYGSMAPTQDEELVPQGEDLDVLVTVTDGQEPHKREGVRHSEIGQAQQHDRS